MLFEIINNSVKEAIRATALLSEEETKLFIEKAARMIAQCYEKGGKLLICGNGGSLCDAMHFAEEMTGQFREKRRALPALALADPGHMSCVSNDMGFDYVYSRAIEALGQKNDLLIVLSTSGKSPNILRALEAASSKGIHAIAFLGKGGGRAKGSADLEWIVDGFAYSDRIQEVHMAAIHIIIEIVEKILFEIQSDSHLQSEQPVQPLCL